MSDKAVEIVVRLAERLNNQGASVEWLERVLEEAGLVELIDAGQASRSAIGAYSIALMRRADGDSTDDSEIQQAIERCVQSTKLWDAALAKLEGAVK